MHVYSERDVYGYRTCQWCKVRSDKREYPHEAGCVVQRAEQAEAELVVTNKLLDERNRVLKAIPECPEHGDQCVPHALEWIEKTTALIALIEGAVMDHDYPRIDGALEEYHAGTA